MDLSIAESVSMAPKWLMIHDTALNKAVSFEDFMGSSVVQNAEMIYFGEYHGHVLGHTTQQLILSTWEEKLLSDHNGCIELALSVEMLERDVQMAVDGYLAGDITEERFLMMSRPPSNYERDYSPLVDFAKDRGYPVLAGNIPRRYASFVANNRTDDVYNMPDIELTYVAPEILAPEDDYLILFDQAMGGHMPPDLLTQYYESQCIKDDTMAMSVADFMKSEGECPRMVAQFVGKFHTDFKLGLFGKVADLLPSTNAVLLSVETYNDRLNSPENPPTLSVGPSGQDQADFVLFAPNSCPGRTMEACVVQCPLEATHPTGAQMCEDACALICEAEAASPAFMPNAVEELLAEMNY